MGFFDFLKKKDTDTKQNLTYIKMLNGNTPVFSSFGADIYMSDVVQQAVNCIISEMKKTQPTHIIKNGTEIMKPKNRVDIQTVLDNPNPIMTTTDFIERIMWQLYLTYNSFVYPIWEDKKLKALYPLNPQNVSFFETPNGKIYVQFLFQNGYKSPNLDYDKIIHIRKNYSGANDFLGGDKTGNPTYDALLKTLNMNEKLLTGVSKGIESSLAVNGVLKVNTYMDEKGQAEELEAFNTKLQNSQSGIITTDLSGDYIPISRQIQFADAELLKWIDSKILRHFGVPLPILTGDYTKAQKEAFFQSTIEKDLVTVDQAFSKGLFSKEERRTGNAISFYYDKLMFLTPEEIASFITEVGGRGALTNNQILALYGMQPYEGGDVRMASLNYINADNIDSYQLGKSRGGTNEE